MEQRYFTRVQRLRYAQEQLAKYVGKAETAAAQYDAALNRFHWKLDNRIAETTGRNIRPDPFNEKVTATYLIHRDKERVLPYWWALFEGYQRLAVLYATEIMALRAGDLAGEVSGAFSTFLREMAEIPRQKGAE